MNLKEALETGGVVVLDKPLGPTSHQVSAWARDMLGLEKLGHGGTLDPEASGVLLLLIGPAMRLTSLVLKHPKTYVAAFRFTGGVPEGVERHLSSFVGETYNVPPEISAVKVQVRSRRIESIEVNSSMEDILLATIECEAGTYIRTIARDLGLLTGTTCNLVELRRTRSGRFSESEAIALEDLKDVLKASAEGKQQGLKRVMHPIASVLEHLPSAIIRESAAERVAHGSPLMRPGIVAIEDSSLEAETVVLRTQDGTPIALAEWCIPPAKWVEMSNGEVFQPRTVLVQARPLSN